MKPPAELIISGRYVRVGSIVRKNEYGRHPFLWNKYIIEAFLEIDVLLRLVNTPKGSYDATMIYTDFINLFTVRDEDNESGILAFVML